MYNRLAAGRWPLPLLLLLLLLLAGRLDGWLAVAVAAAAAGWLAGL